MAIRKSRPSTQGQKDAVILCEEMLGIEFTGNIDNFIECSNFLNKYLDDAKAVYTELKCEYEAAMMELWD